MPNKFYNKGRKHEYKLRDEMLELGCDFAQRTAGSHSPIDVIGVDTKRRIIYIWQGKPKGYKGKDYEEWKEKLDGKLFKIKFKVR